MMTLIDHLSDYRTAKGLTLEELAEQLGVGVGSVRRWFKGASRPSAVSRMAIQRVLRQWEKASPKRSYEFLVRMEVRDGVLWTTARDTLLGLIERDGGEVAALPPGQIDRDNGLSKAIRELVRQEMRAALSGLRHTVADDDAG